MGWLWQSSPSVKAEGSSSVPPATSTTPSSSVAETPPQAKASPSGPESSPGDREIAMFMDMLMKDAQSSSSAQHETQPPPPPSSLPSSLPSQASSDSKSTRSSWLPWASTKPAADLAVEQAESPRRKTRSPQSLAMSEHVLPTTMSCRDAFDYAWHCHTPGSQWNAVYRYGSVRTCSELWDDFWFCMRTKSYPPELRAEAIREHYRAKEEAKYGGGKPSSEDVWESREERVPPGTAFKKSFDPPIVDDAEFQRVDAERRRRIREAIGIEGRGGGGSEKKGE
ncbi:uncharacterized protein P884DRAFT_263728 [Thermothelomyces heterothallicus CBS 202.75]|uniref:uncharacterized protein n=1 Tax=Thermothelomyces heterothallicus CBS 202.75 TaxID=1149848 RepID=UPI0037443A23